MDMKKLLDTPDDVLPKSFKISSGLKGVSSRDVLDRKAKEHEKYRHDLRRINRLRMIDMCLVIGIHPSQLQELSEEDYENYQWYYDQVTRPDSEVLGVHPSLTGLIHVPTVTPHHLRAMLNSPSKTS